MGDLLALPAFIISIIAGLVAVGALVWSIVAWVRSGHRVAVEITATVRNPGRGMTWSGASEGNEWAAESIPPSHVPYSIVLVTITARNRGRAAVNIERFFVTVGKPKEGKNMSWAMKGDPTLPERLEPGASASREYMIADVEAFTRREKHRQFRGAVALGDGSIRRSGLSFDIDARDRGSAFLASSTGQMLQTPAPSEQ